MDYATSMGFVQRIRNLRAEFQYLLQRQRAFFQSFGQRLSLYAFHHQVVHAILAAHVVQHANVRMIQTRNSSCFTLEALLPDGIGRKLSRNNLDRNCSIQPRVPRAIHLAHPARAQRRHDLVRPKFAPGCERHLFSFAAQLSTTDMGCVSACLTCVLIRNRCPSRLTS